MKGASAIKGISNSRYSASVLSLPWVGGIRLLEVSPWVTKASGWEIAVRLHILGTERHAMGPAGRSMSWPVAFGRIVVHVLRHHVVLFEHHVVQH